MHDLLLLRKWILGISPLPSPYSWIAADVNNTQGITTFDLVLIHQQIIGTSGFASNVPSWRFIDADYVIPAGDPLQDPLPESITINNLAGCVSDADFIGVKMGDVSMCSETIHPAFVTVSASHETTIVGNTTKVKFTLDDFTDVTTMQFSMAWDPTQTTFNQITYTNGNPLNLNIANFGQNQINSGILNFAWLENTALGINLSNGTSIFELEFTTSTTGTFPIMITGNPVPKEISDNNCMAYDLNSSNGSCLLYTSPSPRDATLSRMPSSA